MSFATCNSAPVISGRIAVPRIGAWHANLVLDAEDAPSGAVTLDIGGLGFRGWARRSGAWGGSCTARIVGGSGGLANVIAAQGFRRAQLSSVVGHIVREAGEQLDPGADAEALGAMLSWWAVLESQAGEALSAVVQTLGLAWRMTPAGKVWVGGESWPDRSIDGEVLSYTAAADVAELFTPVPSLLPGTKLQGRKVSYVEHAIDPDKLRTRVWFEG